MHIYVSSSIVRINFKWKKDHPEASIKLSELVNVESSAQIAHKN